MADYIGKESQHRSRTCKALFWWGGVNLSSQEADIVAQFFKKDDCLENNPGITK